MVYLLLGPDDFSKTEYLNKLAAEHQAGLRFYADPGEAPAPDTLGQADLFARPEIAVLRGLVANYWEPKTMERLTAISRPVVFVEEKLDRRSGAAKQLLNNPGVQVEDFTLPHGQELNRWLIARAQVLGDQLPAAAAEALAQALGRDDARVVR
ncbi:MAG TPA: hypothetical protein VHA30_02275, partial [Patescibacteria group bacterium]|nr:hypothetical protein [Patescibacteria group bacterium]